MFLRVWDDRKGVAMLVGATKAFVKVFVYMVSYCSGMPVSDWRHLYTCGRRVRFYGIYLAAVFASSCQCPYKICDKNRVEPARVEQTGRNVIQDLAYICNSYLYAYGVSCKHVFNCYTARSRWIFWPGPRSRNSLSLSQLDKLYLNISFLPVI